MPRAAALRASGHIQRDVEKELRANLLAVSRSGRDPWPGIIGFADTVLPQPERASLTRTTWCSQPERSGDDPLRAGALAHRGIVAINELLDRAERIYVSLLSVMERDIQICSYWPMRLQGRGAVP